MAKTYTTVPTKSTGNTVSTSDWNTYVRDNLNNLIVPPSVSVKRASAQSISNTTWTAVSWDTELWDTDSMWSSTPNPTRLTIGTTGLYCVNANVTFTNTASGIGRIVGIRTNGTTVNAVQYQYQLGVGFLAVNHVQAILDLTATDYLEVIVYQDSGGALNLNADASEQPCRVQAVFLGKKS